MALAWLRCQESVDVPRRPGQVVPVTRERLVGEAVESDRELVAAQALVEIRDVQADLRIMVLRQTADIDAGPRRVPGLPKCEPRQVPEEVAVQL
jgi:hypothetical protein